MSEKKAPTKAELETRVADLEAALETSKKENEKLAKTLEQATLQLQQGETKGKTAKEIVVKTEEGNIAFTGSGCNISGTVYTREELKFKPEIVLKLYKSGSELTKKVG